MKVSDSQGPSQQLLTLSLEAESQLQVTGPKMWTLLRLRHLAADLGTVTAFPWRNLPGSLLQLRHHHFVEHQEGLPEEEKKQDNDDIIL